MSLLQKLKVALFSSRSRDCEGSSSESPALLDHLPVDLQFLILTYLPPADLCRLGATSLYWRSLVRDPLLWRYFLIRDALGWTSVDHLSTPNLAFLSEGIGEETEKLDYMSEYLRCSPRCRAARRCPPASTLSFLLQSLVPEAEPRYAMFGAGLEQLEVLLLIVMINSPNVLRVGGAPQRQIDGIGSGISFVSGDQQKFNIITLYSNNRAERERARVEGSSVNNKIFIQEEDDGSGRRRLRVAPQLHEVMHTVNGFIYVANAERDTADVREEDCAQISAALQPMFGALSRPLLVLSCISRNETQRRSSCISVAHQLQLHLLPNPWMVQDVVAESLTGLLEGISWLRSHDQH